MLRGLGGAEIEGHKPAIDFQVTLIDAVLRWILANPAWSIRASILAPLRNIDDPQPLWIGPRPAPTLRNTPPPAEIEQTLAIARKFDVACRDDRNRALGRAGEDVVLLNERLILKQAGQDELAGGVRWISEEDGDGAGYDIHSFQADGADRLIEVKTTNGWERTLAPVRLNLFEEPLDIAWGHRQLPVRREAIGRPAHVPRDDVLDVGPQDHGKGFQKSFIKRQILHLPGDQFEQALGLLAVLAGFQAIPVERL